MDMIEDEIADALPAEGVQSFSDAERVVRKHVGTPETIGGTKFDNIVEALYRRTPYLAINSRTPE
jgi:hypothetical protein